MFGAFFYSYCPVFIITSHLHPIFSLKKINIWAGYLAWARRAIARLVNSCSDVFVVVQRRKINIWAKHRKTLQSSHLKNTNTARAAWSQLSAASCAILSFIDYSLLSGLQCSIQKSHQSRQMESGGILFVVLQNHLINALVIIKKYVYQCINCNACMHKVHALVNFLLILACNDLMHHGI